MADNVLVNVPRVVVAEVHPAVVQLDHRGQARLDAVGAVELYDPVPGASAGADEGHHEGVAVVQR